MKHEKPELSRKNPYRLPKYRYLELKNFCFQYNDWKRALARLDGWRAQEGDMGGIVKSNMENKTLLNETLESGMESLKTMKPGSEEYAAAVNSLAKLHEMQMNETAEENSKTAKEDELQLKWQQVKADVQKADSDRRVEILKTVGGIAGTLIMGGLFVWNQVNGWFNEEEGHIPLSPTFKDGSRTLMQNIFRK